MDLETLAVGRRDPRRVRRAALDAARDQARPPRSTASPNEHSLLRETPIAGILGDQQAATFGQAAFDAGRGQEHLRHRQLPHLQHGRGDRPLEERAAHDRRLQARRRDRCTTRSRARSPSPDRSIQWLRDNLGLICIGAGGRGARRDGRGQRRRVLRAGVLRPVRAVLASGCPRRARRPHPLREQGPHRSRRARGHRVPDPRRPRRGQRRRRRRPDRAARSTAARSPTTRCCSSRPTSSAFPWCVRSSPRRPRSAPRTRPASRSASGTGLDDLRANWQEDRRWDARHGRGGAGPARSATGRRPSRRPSTGSTRTSHSPHRRYGGTTGRTHGGASGPFLARCRAIARGRQARSAVGRPRRFASSAGKLVEPADAHDAHARLGLGGVGGRPVRRRGDRARRRAGPHEPRRSRRCAAGRRRRPRPRPARPPNRRSACAEDARVGLRDADVARGDDVLHARLQAPSRSTFDGLERELAVRDDAEPHARERRGRSRRGGQRVVVQRPGVAVVLEVARRTRRWPRPRRGLRRAPPRSRAPAPGAGPRSQASPRGRTW